LIYSEKSIIKFRDIIFLKGIYISVEKDTQEIKWMNLRGKARTKSLKNASVEFKPAENELVHHFKLKDFSSEGFGILVLKDSKVLKHIKPGNVLTMMYHSNRTQNDPVTHQTEIKHISEPESGTYQGHLVVGLLILE
jgi:hypothetical protein